MGLVGTLDVDKVRKLFLRDMDENEERKGHEYVRIGHMKEFGCVDGRVGNGRNASHFLRAKIEISSKREVSCGVSESKMYIVVR